MCWTVLPVCVPEPSPKFHEYVATVPSESVEPEASKEHDRPTHDCVKLAVGGEFGAWIDGCVDKNKPCARQSIEPFTSSDVAPNVPLAANVIRRSWPAEVT